MDILFIHGNYPAQFRHLASLLAREKKHNIVFMTERRDATKERFEGLTIQKYESHRYANRETHHYLHATEEAVIKGQAVLREIATLLEKGFNPRIVITHGGMGLGLFIKDILPNTKHIGYFEWYFRNNTTKNLVEKYDLDAQLKTGLRNLPILQELDKCDAAVVPTEWQKNQFPKEYRTKLKVIFDGVDTNFFYSNRKELETEDLIISNRESKEEYLLPSRAKILSYATRGMEPVRGFPEFMRILPKLLNEIKDLYVIVAGADRRAYSYNSPSSSGSWKEYVMETLGNFKGKDRIHFTGLLTYNDYRNLMWRSNLHCYFTRPYVTSWSLFEAASCGASLAINKNKATENIVEEKSVMWVDIDNQRELEHKIQEKLMSGEKRKAIIKPGYELTISLNKWEKLLNNTLQSS